MSETYTLLDALPEGPLLRETFSAENDVAARRQARAAAEGSNVQLWKGDELLAQWTRCGAGLCSRGPKIPLPLRAPFVTHAATTH